MFVAISYAADAAAPPVQNPISSMLVPMVLIFGIFYFLIIRPQQKKAKEHTKALEALKSGDEAVTTGGLCGTITKVEGETVILEIADKVRVRVIKSQLYPKKSGEKVEKTAKK